MKGGSAFRVASMVLKPRSPDSLPAPFLLSPGHPLQGQAARLAQDPGVRLSQHQETGVLLPRAVNMTLTDSAVKWESLTPGTAGPSPQPPAQHQCSLFKGVPTRCCHQRV